MGKLSTRMFKPARSGMENIGEVGYDNPRENIDPNVRTRVVQTQEGSIQTAPSNAKDIVNKEYADSIVGTSGLWNVSGQYLVPIDETSPVSAANLVIEGNISGGNVTTGTNPGHLHTLDNIENPAEDKTFVLGNKTLKYNYTAPAELGFEIEADGGFGGDLVHVHQHTGNPGDSRLMILEAEDPNVCPLLISSAKDAAVVISGGYLDCDDIISAANITSISGQTIINKDNITANDAELTSISAQTISNKDDIAVNVVDIAAVSAQTLTNITDIATNVTNITSNDVDIAAVSAQTLLNITDISAVSAQTLTNVIDIAAVSAQTLINKSAGGQWSQSNDVIEPTTTTDMVSAGTLLVAARASAAEMFIGAGTGESTSDAKLEVDGEISGAGLRISSSELVVDSGTTGNIGIGTDGSTEKVEIASGGMTLSAGNLVVIGKASIGTSLINPDGDSEAIVVGTDGSSNANVGITEVGYRSTTDGNFANLRFYNKAANETTVILAGARDGADDAGKLLIYTAPTGGSVTERMRIESDGQVHIGDTDTAADILDVSQTAANIRIARFTQKSATGHLLALEYSGVSPDDNTQSYIQGTDGTTARFFIYSDGDMLNHDGTYGTISDIKYKQDVVPMRSYWNDFKKLEYKKWRDKEDVRKDINAPYRIGLVAQDVEKVFPSLVPTSPEERPNKDGVVEKTGVFKWVKSSIIEGAIMAKVVQELQQRIEVLENRNI